MRHMVFDPASDDEGSLRVSTSGLYHQQQLDELQIYFSDGDGSTQGGTQYLLSDEGSSSPCQSPD
jgi:hypothetical protein